ncbi:MAG TPA: hypothetical protein VJM11_17625, partial [Nevskiaceae bacterium]|nr:hypothetical protein [Nevskiaceae bacterium]
MTRTRPLPGVVCAALAGMLGTAAAVAAPNDVDPAFADDGVAAVDAGRTPDTNQGVVVGADYLYVLANGDTIVRLTPGGTPDPEFGTNGRLTFDDLDFDVTAIGEDPAGGLFLGGNKLSSVVVARIRFDGTLDDDFGDAGYAVIDTAGEGRVRALRYYNLHVWVLGTTATGAGDRDAFVAKLDQGGNPDFGWGFNGVALVNYGTACDQASSFSVETAGAQTVLVGGDTSFGDCAGDVAIARLNPLGELAPSLGDTGIRVVDLGGTDRMGVVVAHTNGTGKFAFAALSTQDGATQQVIARMTDEGRFDPTYANGGRRVGDLPGIDGFAFTGAVGVQSRGQLVYAGTDAAGDVALARLEGSSQLSIDDVAAGNGDGGGNPPGGGGTVLDGGGGGAFGWLTLGVLAGAA